MTGLLLVDKPEETSSAGVIRTLKPRLGRAKVGHLGTLDPFASGLLPLCVGEATKVARYLLLEGKAYEGTIRLGTATDTLDRTGRPLDTRAVPPLDPAALDAVAAHFTGRQRQVPPMYSALKRDGVPLYKLARRGIDVDRPARDIEVSAFRLIVRAPDAVDFVVRCSKGTYVRVLAADVGVALGTVAHLERLRRTEVGSFHVDRATPLATLAADSGPLPLVPVREALAGYAAYAAADEGLARLRQGQQETLRRLPPPERVGQTALLLDASGEVAAIIEATTPGPAWRLVRLLGSSPS